VTADPRTSPLASPDPWNLVSASYTRELAPHCEMFAADALASVPLAAGAAIVDVACGPGTLTLLAAQRGLRVSAIDFSPEMIALLRARAEAGGAAGLIEAGVGDGHALPFASGQFRAGFSVFGLMFFADPARGLVELHRVIAPGGCAVIVSWAPLDRVPAIAALFAALRRAAPELALPAPAAPLGEVDEVRAALIAAGFAGVTVETVAHPLSFDSPAAFWSTFAASVAPVALVRRRLGAARWAAVSAAAVGDLSAALGPGAVLVPMPAHIGIGWR